MRTLELEIDVEDDEDVERVLRSCGAGIRIEIEETGRDWGVIGDGGESYPGTPVGSWTFKTKKGSSHMRNVIDGFKARIEGTHGFQVGSRFLEAKLDFGNREFDLRWRTMGEVQSAVSQFDRLRDVLLRGSVMSRFNVPRPNQNLAMAVETIIEDATQQVEGLRANLLRLEGVEREHRVLQGLKSGVDRIMHFVVAEGHNNTYGYVDLTAKFPVGVSVDLLPLAVEEAINQLMGHIRTATELVQHKEADCTRLNRELSEASEEIMRLRGLLEEKGVDHGGG